MTCRFVAAVALVLLLTQSARAQPQGDDPLTAEYLRARKLYQDNRLVEAVIVFEQLVTDHRDHAVAVHAVDLLLDALNRLEEYDRMGEWAARLRADARFLAGHPELAERLAILDYQVHRKRAEALERSRKYRECGQAYLDIYNGDPTQSQGDEVLYNAGVCFEMDRSVGLAVTVYRTLSTSFPKSRLNRRAMARSAHLYASIAHYDKAIPIYREYVRRFPGEKNSDDFLSTAIALARATGAGADADRMTELYIKLYGARTNQQRVAARLAFAAIGADDRRDTVKRIEKFLKRWSRVGGTELAIVANARLGEILWRQACPGTVDDSGLCVRTTWPDRNRCARARQLQPLRRNKKLAARAVKAFRTAVRLYPGFERSRPGISERRAARRAHAKARFYLLEADFAAYLAVSFPTGLDFDPGKPKKVKALTRRFLAFIDEKSKLQTALYGGPTAPGGSPSHRRTKPSGDSYSDLLAMKVDAGQWATAAAARAAQAARDFADKLLGGEIPVHARTGKYASDNTRAYCDELRRQVEPLEASARTMYEACLHQDVGASSDRWRALCQRELESWQPRRYPPLVEIHAPPAATTPIIALEPLVD